MKQNREQKYTHINIVNWSLTKEERPYKGANILSLTDGAIHSHAQNQSINLDRGLTLFTKLNSVCIIDLKGKFKTINLLEDNMKENPDDVGYANAFLI